MEGRSIELKDDWNDMDEQTMRRIGEVRESLIKKEKGGIDQGIQNCVSVLELDPIFSGAIRSNLLSGRIDIVKDPGWRREPDSISITDEDMSNIYYYLERFYCLRNEKNIMKAIRVVANRNEYHPIRDELLSLSWDGKSRIREALHRFPGADESDLTYECFRIFLLGAVERVFHPGCKFEIMLCLVGDQGAGKSSFFRFLALRDEWFSDDIKRLDDDNVYRKMAGHWIMEMAEMLGTASAKSVEEIKAFLSRQKETYKVPYDRFPKDRPRQCVFVGTSNKQRFLPLDRTGNRRFYPIMTDSSKAAVHVLSDEEATREYMRQLWAEVMVIYQSGEYSLCLPKEMEHQLSRHRMNFMAEDTASGMLQAWLDGFKGDYVCTKQIYNEAYKMPGEPDRKTIGEINEIMNNTVEGWAEGPQHRFSEYGQQRSWIRSSADCPTKGEDGFQPISDPKQLDFLSEWQKS